MRLILQTYHEKKQVLQLVSAYFIRLFFSEKSHENITVYQYVEIAVNRQQT